MGGWGMSQYLKSVRERLTNATHSYDLVILSFFSGNDFTRDATSIPSSFVVELSRATIGPAAPGLNRSAFYVGCHQYLRAREIDFIADRIHAYFKR